LYILAFKKKEKKFYVMNTKKLVSIGLTVLNGEEFLEDAIQSVLNQTYTKLELIISDNASTDETRKLCKKYAYFMANAYILNTKK
jgi:glycosyltransferase involved in cell wall biosynthesis